MNKPLRLWFVRIDVLLPFQWDNVDKTDIRYLLGCGHIGKLQNRPHIHFYMELEKPQRPSWIRKRFGVPKTGVTCNCVGVWNDGEQCCNYVRDPTKLVGPLYEYGTSGGQQGISKEMNIITDELKKGKPLSDLAIQYPSTFVRNWRGLSQFEKIVQSKTFVDYKQKTVIVYYGETGVGKTKAAYDYCKDKNSPPAWLNPPLSKTSTLFFNDYVDQKILIIDEFTGWIYPRTLLRILDGYPFDCNVKFNNVLKFLFPNRSMSMAVS